MREDPNRRNVMATGVAAALAAPMSTLTAASVSANMGEDWPEFAEWVELVKKSDAQWQHLSDLNAVYAFNPDRPKLEEIWRLEEAAGSFDRQIYRSGQEMLEKREILTERHQAMAVAILIWASPHAGYARFNPTNISECGNETHLDEIALKALLTVLVRHYIRNHVLDMVPWCLATEA